MTPWKTLRKSMGEWDYSIREIMEALPDSNEQLYFAQIYRFIIIFGREVQEF
jgi:hypothetical protein